MPSVTSNTCPEIYAEYERHLGEVDQLIAERFHLKPDFIRHLRETNWVYWLHLEHQVKSQPGPATISPAFQPGEFVRWSQRPENRLDSTAHTLRRDWPGWLTLLVVAFILFGQRIPGVHEWLTGWMSGGAR